MIRIINRQEQLTRKPEGFYMDVAGRATHMSMARQYVKEQAEDYLGGTFIFLTAFKRVAVTALEFNFYRCTDRFKFFSEKICQVTFVYRGYFAYLVAMNNNSWRIPAALVCIA